MRVFMLIAISLLLFGCYTRKKADRQINAAAVSFPDILAKKARYLFPCVTTKGDTIWVSDSAEYNEVLNELQNDNLFLYQQHDSLLKQVHELIMDTSCADDIKGYVDIIDKLVEDFKTREEKYKRIPPVTITKIIHDTAVDNAAVQACEFDKSKLIVLLENETKDGNNWHKKAKNRFWWILGMGGIIGAGGYFMISGYFKRKALKKLKSV